MMEVRRLTVGDLAAYRALHRMGLEESPTAFVEATADDAKRPDGEIEAMLARGEGWGVFIEGALVGKLTIDTLPYATLAHTRWVHALYVAREARGSGAAALLVEGAIAAAAQDGASVFSLWVSAENAAARAFYERLGFKQAGRIPGGLDQGGRRCDDILMCLARV
ncbi:MAG: GNAT family N-acetyltransferase [Hyphomonadaceae bacterium]|nr:GNAT family N-acetyltransferase [Hyphomonadaceae bacterium]